MAFDTLQFLDRIERLYPEQEYNLTFQEQFYLKIFPIYKHNSINR